MFSKIIGCGLAERKERLLEEVKHPGVLPNSIRTDVDDDRFYYYQKLNTLRGRTTFSELAAALEELAAAADHAWQFEYLMSFAEKKAEVNALMAGVKNIWQVEQLMLATPIKEKKVWLVGCADTDWKQMAIINATSETDIAYIEKIIRL